MDTNAAIRHCVACVDGALTDDQREELLIRIAGAIEGAMAAERERCSAIIHNHQIAFCSDTCGWALDRIKDGLPPDAIRTAPNSDK